MKSTIILILLIIFATGCQSFSFGEKTNNDKQTPVTKPAQNINVNNINKNGTALYYPKTHNENYLLAQIEAYIRNTEHLIKKAEVLQAQQESRIKFNYDNLRLDLSEVARAIENHINRNSHDTSYRIFTPLSKRY